MVFITSVVPRLVSPLGAQYHTGPLGAQCHQLSNYNFTPVIFIYFILFIYITSPFDKFTQNDTTYNTIYNIQYTIYNIQYTIYNIQCNAMQCNAMPMQCNAMQYKTVQYIVQYNTYTIMEIISVDFFKTYLVLLFCKAIYF